MTFSFTNFPCIANENIPLCYSRSEATANFNAVSVASGNESILPALTSNTATQNQPVAYFITPNSTGSYTGTVICKAIGNPNNIWAANLVHKQ